jgi:hypothetical protein
MIFLSSFRKLWDINLIRSYGCLSKSLTIHFSPINIPFDDAECELLRSLLNEQKKKGKKICTLSMLENRVLRGVFGPKGRK